jgi:hypothetical protein
MDDSLPGSAPGWTAAVLVDELGVTSAIALGQAGSTPLIVMFEDLVGPL